MNPSQHWRLQLKQTPQAFFRLLHHVSSITVQCSHHRTQHFLHHSCAASRWLTQAMTPSPKVSQQVSCRLNHKPGNRLPPRGAEPRQQKQHSPLTWRSRKAPTRQTLNWTSTSSRRTTAAGRHLRPMSLRSAAKEALGKKYIDTYIQTYIHTYIHTYICIYILVLYIKHIYVCICICTVFIQGM